MVSVAELLNPEPLRAPLPTSRPAPVSPAHQTLAFRNEAAPVRPSVETLRMIETNKNPSRGKSRAAVNFPPFEVLDEPSLREVRRFEVHPFGSIQETCERIPYNSGKKDFFSKTGREGFEAFHYDFKVPGDDTNYTVMWDYSVGLVRMTSFFKCRGYSKTTPAKMLNQNPGLKDITYSITGGSIKAQGYWMPYSCARAICATFCHKIAGALIPLFGPQFPFECIPEKAPGHGRMVIGPEIVERARNDAAALFRPTAALPSPRPSRSVSPLPSQRSARGPEPYDYHSDYDRRMLLSPYTDTDVDYRPASDHHYGRRACPTMPPLRIPTSSSRPPIGPAPAPTPQHSPGWTAVNQPPPPPPPPHLHPAYHRDPRAASHHLHSELLGLNVSATANPWLSAVPRSPTPGAGGGDAGKWQQHPYYPRSHHPHHPHPHPHHHHHHETSSPAALSASLPEHAERGITLAPLRLNKRRFSKVSDGRNPDNHHPNKNAAENGDGGDEEYDASSSQAGSASPASVTAASTLGESITKATDTPPRSPVSTGSGSGTLLGAQAVAGAAAGSNDNDNNRNRRPSERNAAMMLMHMMHMHPRRDSSDGGGESSPPPPPPPPTTTTMTTMTTTMTSSRGGSLAVGCGGRGAGSGGESGGETVRRRPSSWVVPAPAASGEDGKDGTPPPPPCSPSSPSRTVPAGHTTRSKRRRTLER
ncbi:transcriptional repressor XBP1 [Parachaetomium inaequale]|uniref:Transcriptional repressor XBP1 n=1 Tax=Parachaetomium inaequale TaxID=2588326 RepID=A0AAN6P8K9_9PEZI|nr:transcriptional repressor XBP1 [Parachaetomium inaequale]